MSQAMEQLYQQLILEHAKDPHGKGLRDGAVAESHQVNPTCGDEVTLRLHLAEGAPEPTVAAVSWTGQGCSISQASISVMAGMIEGLPVTEAQRLGATFRDLMGSRGAGLDEVAEDELGDATAFTGVSRYPARIKCALLGWAALKDTFARAGIPAGTEEDR